jgi:hypothetical protein
VALIGALRSAQMMDRDKSYTLDRQELEEGMSKQGLGLTVAEIDLLINFYDNDGAKRSVSMSSSPVGVHVFQLAVWRSCRQGGAELRRAFGGSEV